MRITIHSNRPPKALWFFQVDGLWKIDFLTNTVLSIFGGGLVLSVMCVKQI